MVRALNFQKSGGRFTTSSKVPVPSDHKSSDHKSSRRRSQKDRKAWTDMTKLVAQWLPRPRIQHPWPNQRFAVKYPRWKPDAGKPHVRFCAGGA
jgi:hypothetical protein